MENIINDNELENVTGGLHNYKASAGYKVEVDGVEYDVVDEDWDCPCRALGHDPVPKDFFDFAKICLACRDFHFLEKIGKEKINGWRGYCTWK